MDRITKMRGGLFQALLGTWLKKQPAQRQMLPGVDRPGYFESPASGVGFFPQTQSFRIDLADKEQRRTCLEEFFRFVQDQQGATPTRSFFTFRGGSNAEVRPHDPQLKEIILESAANLVVQVGGQKFLDPHALIPEIPASIDKRLHLLGLESLGSIEEAQPVRDLVKIFAELQTLDEPSLIGYLLYEAMVAWQLLRKFQRASQIGKRFIILSPVRLRLAFLKAFFKLGLQAIGLIDSIRPPNSSGQKCEKGAG
jgi:hypothetical protein